MSDAVIVALVTLAGVTVTAVFGYLGARYSRKAARSAESVNDAVNHRLDGEPRLLDIVKEIRSHQLHHGDQIEIINLKIDLMTQDQNSADKRIHRLEDRQMEADQ